MAALISGIIWAQSAAPTPVAPPPSAAPAPPAPFVFADFTWLNRRGASVPYFAGPGGVTPPGGNQGAPGSVVQAWAPDLRKLESRLTFALLVKF